MWIFDKYFLFFHKLIITFIVLFSIIDSNKYIWYSFLLNEKMEELMKLKKIILFGMLYISAIFYPLIVSHIIENKIGKLYEK